MISIQQLYKTYQRGTESVEAICGIDLDINKGEFVVILGPSGGGKSTLLNLIGGIDHPTSGTIAINGFALEKASEESLTRFRRDHIGFIFQFYNLLSALNAAENVSLPLMAKGVAFKQANLKATQILTRLGLEKRLKHLPSELSGGEQQRVAIARSIIAEPELILADEPTGDLDSRTADEITGLMRELNIQMGLTFVVATHNLRLAENADRVFELRDGKIHPNHHDKTG
ncbi:MAG: ABC transporter ATP-binding protein [Chloroflexi bacterium]|nr:ABC transporter ATP-binding protein [Chloroflexota bacterium]